MYIVLIIICLTEKNSLLLRKLKCQMHVFDNLDQIVYYNFVYRIQCPCRTKLFSMNMKRTNTETSCVWHCINIDDDYFLLPICFIDILNRYQYQSSIVKKGFVKSLSLRTSTFEHLAPSNHLRIQKHFPNGWGRGFEKY